MSGNDLARSFLESVAGFTGQSDRVTPSQDKPVKLGTIDPSYSGAGSPQVLFDGESLMGVSGYPYSGTQPVAGDRVVLLPQGRSYVIIGPVGKVETKGSNLPAGSSIEGHWTAAPSGFLLEDGAVYNRADQVALFVVLGVRYNTGGETSAQFRVPNSTGRVGVNQAASGTFATLGDKSGAETHTLTVAEMPAHSHSTGISGSVSGAYNVGNSSAQVAHDQSSGVRTGPDGGGGAHDNIQPSLVVLRVIKT